LLCSAVLIDGEMSCVSLTCGRAGDGRQLGACQLNISTAHLTSPGTY